MVRAEMASIGWCRLSLLAATVSLAGSCGEPVLSGTAYDSPMLAIRGKIDMPAAQVPPVHLRVAVLWIDPFQQSDSDIPSSPQTVGMALNDDDGADGKYALNFYAPPPPETAVDVPSGDAEAPARASVGEFVLFDDTNNDRRFEVTPRVAGSKIVWPDCYRGGGLPFFVFYVWHSSNSATLIHRMGDVVTQAGYREASVDCSLLDAAVINGLDPLRDVNFELKSPSSQRSFERTCLLSATEAEAGCNP
jgi:hypothetical protein